MPFDKLNVCLFDDLANGLREQFAEEEFKFRTLSFDTIENKDEKTEIEEYFKPYWIKNPSEIWAYRLLVTKILASNACLLNHLLPDIMSVDFAFKDNGYFAIPYEASFERAKQIVEQMKETEPGLYAQWKEFEEVYRKISPLPELRSAAKEVGVSQKIIDSTKFSIDQENWDLPDGADYTLSHTANDVQNVPKTKGEARDLPPDLFGFLGGLISYLLTAKIRGTGFVTHTAYVDTAFKNTVAAYIEFLIGDDRKQCQSIRRRYFGVKEKAKNWTPLISDGVYALRENLVELAASGAAVFNPDEIEDLLSLFNRLFKNIDEYAKKITENVEKAEYRRVLPVDASVVVETVTGKRRLPLHGLFFDVRPQNIKLDDVPDAVFGIFVNRDVPKEVRDYLMNPVSVPYGEIESALREFTKDRDDGLSYKILHDLITFVRSVRKAKSWNWELLQNNDELQKDLSYLSRMTSIIVWANRIKDTPFMRSINEAEILAERLFTACRKKELRAQRQLLSEMLGATVSHWQGGKEGLPANVKSRLASAKSISHNAFMTYLDQFVKNNGTPNAGIYKENFKKLDCKFDTEELDCMKKENLCYLNQKSNIKKSVCRWTVFFVYAQLLCWNKVLAEASTALDNATSSQAVAMNEFIVETFGREIKLKIGVAVLYDALYPLPPTPPVLPWSKGADETKPNRCWTTLNGRSGNPSVLDVDLLLDNQLKSDDRRLFRKGEYMIIKNYKKRIMEKFRKILNINEN